MGSGGATPAGELRSYLARRAILRGRGRYLWPPPRRAVRIDAGGQAEVVGESSHANRHTAMQRLLTDHADDRCIPPAELVPVGRTVSAWPGQASPNPHR